MKVKLKPHRSLRTTLIVWFLAVSLVPLAFLAGYSIIGFESTADQEVAKRLKEKSFEVQSIFKDLSSGLARQRKLYLENEDLSNALTSSPNTDIANIGKSFLATDPSHALTFFDKNGTLTVSVFKDASGKVQTFFPPSGSGISLSQENISQSETQAEQFFIDYTQNGKVLLIALSKIRSAGYIEQVLQVDQPFLNQLKRRLNVESLVLRRTGEVEVATHPDFFSYKKDFFRQYTKSKSKSLLDLNLQGVPYGFYFSPIKWGNNTFSIAIGGSKQIAQVAIRHLNNTFFLVIGAVLIILVASIIFISNVFVRPIRQLAAAAKNLQHAEVPYELPIRADTEIGLLTESFNEMSRHVIQAKTELLKKVSELEAANVEIKETQAKLAHSSKMISLGQVVAGVAHELNNPISFIYSNMSHLRDYSEKLIRAVNIAEKNPEQLSQAKKDLEIDFIQQDLPKLISSCEEGARRVKEIVAGLRNFSRLEEDKLKELNINQAIDMTLELLTGEIKNRLEVHKYYGDIPPVLCRANQINQVIMNILSNATQAIEGTGSLWITTKSFENESGVPFVSILIQDSGHGMPKEVLERIFEPFFSTKGVGQGTGLGLSISYGIVTGHGGEIHVKSQVGVGTEFNIMIPVQAKNP